MSALRRESRPGGESQAAEISVGNQINDSLDVRCARCGHLLTAKSSVRRGIGPVCVRLEAVA